MQQKAKDKNTHSGPWFTWISLRGVGLGQGNICATFIIILIQIRTTGNRRQAKI